MGKLSGGAIISMSERVRLAEKRASSLQRQLLEREEDWLRMKKLYEPEQPAVELSHQQVVETETQLRQRQAASLASGEGSDAEYLENARRAAWHAVHADKVFTDGEPIEIGGKPLNEKYPSGWPEALPKSVVVNRYVQLSDDGGALADWSKVEGGHTIAHPGAAIGRPVPLGPPEKKEPATFLHRLAEKRGVKIDD